MIKLKRIVLDINGHEFSLTLEDAKALKDALDEIFEKEVEKEFVPYYPYPYGHPYTSPYYTYPYTYGTYTIDTSEITITPTWEGGLRTMSGGGCGQSLGGIPWTDGSWSTSLCNDIVNKTYT